MHLNARSKPSWTECYIRWLWAALGHTNENFISQDKSCLCAGRVGMLFQAFPTKLSTSRALWSCVRLGPPVCRIACAQYVRINLFCKREKALPRAVDSHAAHSWLLYPCSFRLPPRLATYVKRDRRTDTFCHGCFTGQGWGSVGMAEAVKWVY